jgi:hypothetical protein
MAIIYEEIFVVKLSKLVKPPIDNNIRLASDNFVENLETIIQELVDPTTIVEIEETDED